MKHGETMIRKNDAKPGLKVKSNSCFCGASFKGTIDYVYCDKAVVVTDCAETLSVNLSEIDVLEKDENPYKIQVYDYVKTNCEYARVLCGNNPFEGVVQEICYNSAGYIATVEDTSGSTRAINVTLLEVVKKFNCFGKGDYVRFVIGGNCYRKGTVIRTNCQMATVETKEHDRYRVCYSDMRHAGKRPDCTESIPTPCNFKKGDLVKWRHCGKLKWGKINMIGGSYAWVDSEKEYIVPLDELMSTNINPLQDPDYINKGQFETFKSQINKELSDILFTRNTEIRQSICNLGERISTLEDTSDLSMIKTWLVVSIVLGTMNAVLFFYALFN